MVSRKDFEQAANVISQLDRDELTSRIKGFHGRFKLDFTVAYLANLSVDRLRHILLAAEMTQKNHN